MTSINQSSGQGALFELVARGVKDTYFLKDSKESFYPYDASYESSAHHLAERKTIVPIRVNRRQMCLHNERSTLDRNTQFYTPCI